MLARSAAEIVLTQLRIRESLRARLEEAAKENRTSLNKEIERRLEDSFEVQAKLDLVSIKDDLMRAWLRYGDRFLALEATEGIFAAIEKGDLETARGHLFLLRKNQEGAAR